MKYYVVMDISRATEKNPSFAGCASVHFVGKDQHMIGCAASGDYAKYAYSPCSGWSIHEYAYARRCGAVRNWVYNNPSKNENWEHIVRIVEVSNAFTPGAAAEALDKLSTAVIDALVYAGAAAWDQMEAAQARNELVTIWA